MTGQKVGPYQVVAKLGEGGMGVVYRARDTRLNRDVALKVLPASFAQDADRLRRFTLEAQTAGGLNHANVLTIYEVGDYDGQPFLAAELLEGETLRAKLAAGPLPVSKAVDYARQAAAGLAAAHARQIAHRDIKPENLFVTTDGRVKILDFGLAKQADAVTDTEGTRLNTDTSPGTVLGTVGYMSPEQVRGGRVDHRSDLFSLGVVLYEMLSGARPFTGGSAVETMNAILTQDPPEPTAPGRALPPALADVVRHALEKGPDERFQSARDMAFALQAAATSSGSSAMPAIDAGRRWPLRPPVAIAAAAVAGALAGALVMWVARPSGSREVDLQARRFTPLAMDASIELQPTWSPDGRSLAYFSIAHRPIAPAAATSARPRVSLVVKDVDAPAMVTLVPQVANGRSIFWWPDSTRVGYVDDTGIWSVSRVGGDPERLQTGTYLAASLSPDGRTLACWKITTEEAAATAALWIASPANGALVRYERGFSDSRAYTPVFLRFAPDGGRLLLSGYLPDPADPGDYTPAVWEIAGTTPETMTAPRRLFASHVWATPPDIAWFPDGHRVALAGDAPGLWLGRLDDDSVAKLTDGLAGEGWPSVSPDGQRIAFQTRRDNFDLVGIPLDGAPLVDVIAASPNEFAGGETADGQLVYVSTQSGRDEIRVRAPGGFDRAVVTARDFPDEAVGELAAPIPSPDGQRVAFQRLFGDAMTTWIAPISGGAPVRAAPPRAISAMPDWSPDGRWVAYATMHAGVSQILKQRVGSSEPPAVLVDGIADVSAHLLAWSPDGAWIAHDSPDGLSLVGADGGARRVLVAGTRPRAVAWSRDSRTIYALVLDDAGRRLVAVDARSGAVGLVRPLPEDLEFTAAVSPGLRMTLNRDGTQLLTTALRTRSDIWMMEGF